MQSFGQRQGNGRHCSNQKQNKIKSHVIGFQYVFQVQIFVQGVSSIDCKAPPPCNFLKSLPNV